MCRHFRRLHYSAKIQQFDRVFHIGVAKKDVAEIYIRKAIPKGLCTLCFHLVHHMKKKIHGRWNDYYSYKIDSA